MTARRYSRAETGFIMLNGIAAVAGLWMVAVALGGDEGLLAVPASPRTTSEAPTLDPAQVVRHDASTAAPIATIPRPSVVGRLLSAPLPARPATVSTPANQFIFSAESDPRQQLLSTAVAVRRGNPSFAIPGTPGATSPPLRPGDQT